MLYSTKLRGISKDAQLQTSFFLDFPVSFLDRSLSLLGMSFYLFTMPSFLLSRCPYFLDWYPSLLSTFIDSPLSLCIPYTGACLGFHLFFAD
jgi:hypothetical protein